MTDPAPPPPRRREPLRAAGRAPRDLPVSAPPAAPPPPAAPAEAVVASLVGTDPRKASKSKAVSVLFGFAGTLVVQAIRRRRGELLVDAGRELRLTDRRLQLLDGDVAVAEVALDDVVGTDVKKAFSNAFRRVLTISSATGAPLRIEGDHTRVAAFAEALASHTKPVPQTAEPSFWVLRAFVVGILFVFGVGSLLLAIPIALDQGIGSGLVSAVIGVGFVALGIGARRLLLRRRPAR